MNLMKMTELERMALVATQVSVYGIHTDNHGLVRNKSIYMGLNRLRPNSRLGGMTRKEFAKVSVFNNAGEIVTVRGNIGCRSLTGGKRYHTFGINGGNYKAAVINIWMLTGLNVHGTEYVVDHIDGTDWNDSLGNLRIVNASVNHTLRDKGKPRLLPSGNYAINACLALFGIRRIEPKNLNTEEDAEILLGAVRDLTDYPVDSVRLPEFLERLRVPPSVTLANILTLANERSGDAMDYLWLNKSGTFKSSAMGNAMKFARLYPKNKY